MFVVPTISYISVRPLHTVPIVNHIKCVFCYATAFFKIKRQHLKCFIIYFILLVKDSCTTGSLRLIAEPNTHKGRIEICMDGVWGSICSRYWDNNDARVACHQLGYSKYGN